MKRFVVMMLMLVLWAAGSAAETIKLDVPLWLQKDERWADDLINPDGGKQTIAKAGCALCCLASTESLRQGEKVRPDELNEWLEFSEDDLHWPREYETLAKSKEGLLVKQAGPILLACLRSGRPALVCLSSPELGTHWVVIYGCENLDPENPQTAHFLIRDPGTKYRVTFNETKEYFPKIRVIRTYDVTDELRRIAEESLAL